MRTLLLIALMLAGSPAWAQSCDGVEVEAARERLCLKPGSRQAFRDCPACPEMVLVPPGTFTMGSPAAEERAGPQEEQLAITIARPFAVGRFAVTRDEFATFVAVTARRIEEGCFVVQGETLQRDNKRTWRDPGFVQDGRHPAVCVSWNDAKAYAAWLSQTTGKSYRLLTETEREYVARAGSATAFWWGNTISADRANYNSSVAYAGVTGGTWRRATVPVDAFVANPWGLFNVHGNVWDWTEDCWNMGNTGNPGTGAARTQGDCSLRVMRGGGWGNFPHTLRSARRGRETPDSRINTVGFRIARTL
ncbi:MAG: formylglycine-generating enzyme family protein [Alphaproteobacteria bacterium]|nr:formylglycine-generating enzyme family protein [Alphaproteobacteria bacterium]